MKSRGQFHRNTRKSILYIGEFAICLLYPIYNYFFILQKFKFFHFYNPIRRSNFRRFTSNSQLDHYINKSSDHSTNRDNEAQEKTHFCNRNFSRGTFKVNRPYNFSLEMSAPRFNKLEPLSTYGNSNYDETQVVPRSQFRKQYDEDENIYRNFNVKINCAKYGTKNCIGQSNIDLDVKLLTYNEEPLFSNLVENELLDFNNCLYEMTPREKSDFSCISSQNTTFDQTFDYSQATSCISDKDLFNFKTELDLDSTVFGNYFNEHTPIQAAKVWGQNIDVCGENNLGESRLLFDFGNEIYKNGFNVHGSGGVCANSEVDPMFSSTLLDTNSFKLHNNIDDKIKQIPYTEKNYNHFTYSDKGMFTFHSKNQITYQRMSGIKTLENNFLETPQSNDVYLSEYSKQEFNNSTNPRSQSRNEELTGQRPFDWTSFENVLKMYLKWDDKA